MRTIWAFEYSGLSFNCRTKTENTTGVQLEKVDIHRQSDWVMATQEVTMINQTGSTPISFWQLSGSPTANK